MSGKRVGNWVIDKKLGEGGMGKVWRAHHYALKHPAAVKIVAEELLADTQFATRFMQEAGAQALLRHPHILGVIDFFEEHGAYYLILPFIDGQSLEERMRAGPLPLVTALDMAGRVLSALDHAHQKRVIHRDVKPSNILIDRDGHPYLADFGIALMVGRERKTRTGTSIGTPHYMSPEQISRPRAVDHRTDVYSFGCVLYEMLTGRPPFVADEAEGDSDFAIKQAHVQRTAEPLRRWNPAIPEPIEAAVMRALEKDPEGRFGGCAEFARELAQAEHGLVDLIHCASCAHPNRVDRSQPSVQGTCGKCGEPLLPEGPRQEPGGTLEGIAWKIAAAGLLITTLIAASSCGNTASELDRVRSTYDAAVSRATGLDNELQKERNLRQDLAESWPVTVRQIRLRNQGGQGNVLGDYASSFSRESVRFVAYYVTLLNNFRGIRNLQGTLRVKYIRPDGSLSQGQGSPAGFTLERDINLSDTQEVTESWGNETASTYGPGTHRVEFWWAERKIGETVFSVR